MLVGFKCSGFAEAEIFEFALNLTSYYLYIVFFAFQTSIDFRRIGNVVFTSNVDSFNINVTKAICYASHYVGNFTR